MSTWLKWPCSEDLWLMLNRPSFFLTLALLFFPTFILHRNKDSSSGHEYQSSDDPPKLMPSFWGSAHSDVQ